MGQGSSKEKFFVHQIREMKEEHIRDTEKHYEQQMQKEMDVRKELCTHYRETMEIVKGMYAQTLEHHTKQIEALSIGMQNLSAITSMNKLAQTLVLRKPCVIMIDNIEQKQLVHKRVKMDQEILFNIFRHIKADVRPVLGSKSIEISGRECAKENYSANDGIIVFLFSYGSNMRLQDKHDEVEVRRIMEFFFQNSSLARKPKIFIVQTMDKREKKEREEAKPPNETDYLLCYCEMVEKAYIQKVDRQSGSAFINSLYDAFTKDKECDIAKILQIVGKSMDAKMGTDATFTIEDNLNTQVQLMIP